MWFTIWGIVAMLANPVNTGLKETQHFDTEAACLAHLEQLKEHMPDFARGHYNLSFDTEVLVDGRCVEDGKPA